MSDKTRILYYNKKYIIMPGTIIEVIETENCGFTFVVCEGPNGEIVYKVLHDGKYEEVRWS